MAYTLVQSKSAHGNSGTSASVSGLTATTAGNLLLLFVDTSKNPGDVTFTPPANWTQVGSTQHQDVFIAISGAAYYYVDNPGSITSVSVTLSSSVSAWRIFVLEFSGVATSSPLDASALTTTAGTKTPTSGNITTTAAADLLVGYMSEDDVNGAYTLTQPSGWTGLTRNQDAGAWGSQYIAWDTAGSAGTEAYSPALSSTATDSIIGVLAFLAAGGGTTALTASAATGIGTAANATLSLAVALSASAATGNGTAANAALAEAVALSASAATGVGVATTATLAVAVALSASPASGEGTTQTATFALAVALAATAANGLATTTTATLSLGGALVASPASGNATAATATLSIALALTATPALASAVTQSATLALAVALTATAALAQAIAANATLSTGLAAVPGSASLSDAPVGAASVSDALVDGATIGDAAVGVLTLSDT